MQRDCISSSQAPVVCLLLPNYWLQAMIPSSGLKSEVENYNHSETWVVLGNFYNKSWLLHCCYAVDEKPCNISVLFWSCEAILKLTSQYPNWVCDVFVYLHQQMIFVQWCFKTAWGLFSKACSWLLYPNHPTA